MHMFSLVFESCVGLTYSVLHFIFAFLVLLLQTYTSTFNLLFRHSKICVHKGRHVTNSVLASHEKVMFQKKEKLKLDAMAT